MALLEFYGDGCPHCEEMKPLVDRLKKKEKISIESFEVWHNEAKAEKMAGYDCGVCGGVPFFVNTETKKVICGKVGYEDLKIWAKGG